MLYMFVNRENADFYESVQNDVRTISIITTCNLHCSNPQLHDEREGSLLDDDGHVHGEGSSGWENPL